MKIQAPVQTLVRDRSDNMWRLVNFHHVNEMKKFIEGPIINYPLPFNMELWLNQDHHQFQEEGPTLIIPDVTSGKELLFFGNCFLSSCEPGNQLASITPWQTDYVLRHSELLKSLTPDVVTAVLLNIEAKSIN